MKKKPKPKTPAKSKTKPKAKVQPKPKPKVKTKTKTKRPKPAPATSKRLTPRPRKNPTLTPTPAPPPPPPPEDDLPLTGDEDVLLAPDADESAVAEEMTPALLPTLDAAGLSAAPATELTRYEIKHDLVKRLDIYLRDRIPNVSRAALQRLIKSGAVTVNGRAPKSSTILRANDVVELMLPKSAAPRTFIPENIPLDIVHEDDAFLAVNKQAGLIVHPARGHWTGTLINALMYHSQQTGGALSTGSDPWRPGIIHRLDRDTTGLILIAKTDEAHWRIAGQFERRTIKKTYLAIVHGEMDLDRDLIDAPLAVHPHAREKYAVRRDLGADARPAQTVYIVKERFKGYTLLELHPKTGRTHQLRVHCAYIHHPIVGDTMYGGRPVSLTDIESHAPQSTLKTPDPAAHLITRQALHAHRLQLVHPMLFTRLTLEAPLPPDMANLLDLLRKHRRL